MKAIISLLILITAVNPVAAYRAAFNICRIDETGVIIGGPVELDSQAGVICKVSEAGYVYTYDEYDFRCFDSSFNLINSVDTYGPYEVFGIDNVRNEIIAKGLTSTIMRYNPTLDLLEEINIPTSLHRLTVDPSDGYIWYTSGHQDEEGLYKVTREGDLTYYFPDGFNGCLTTVSPQGSFWVSDIAPSYHEGIRLMESDGGITTEADVKLRYVIDMYFSDESCWFISNDPIGISKVNSSGSVVYLNSTDFDRPRDLAIDQDDGSVWIADTYNYDIVHLDQSGTELLRVDWDWVARAIAVDPAAGTVIVVSSLGDVTVEPTSVGRIKALFK